MSVVVEKVSLPVGLPQHPIVDLVGWKGSAQNPFFIELLGHLEQAAERKAPAHPGNRLSRIRKKLFAGLTFGVVVACIFGVTMNVLGVQNNVCSIDFAQPGLSDFCGGFGLGDKPTRKERLAWEARTPGSCDAIRSHIETFGDKGALHSVAADLLAARRTSTEVYWVDDTQSAPFSQSFATVGAETEAEARAAALANAGRAAEASCKAYGQGDLYKVKGHKIEVDAWDCTEFSSGHYCGFDGKSICLLERRVEEQREFCG